MVYREFVFDKNDFPEKIRGMHIMNDIPCRQVYLYRTVIPKFYLILATVEPMPRSLANAYGCDDVVSLQIDFMNDANTRIDNEERDGVIHNILKTNGLIGKEKRLEV